MSDKIILGNLEFYGHCGASDDERQVGGRFSVEIELSYDLRTAGASDDLSHTVNYSQVFKLVKRIGERESFHLLEALAERMAQAILEAFPVEEVRLRLKKLAPPMAGFTGYAGVEITRSHRA